MTTRQKFSRRLRRFGMPMYVGLFLVAAGAVAMDRFGQLAIYVLIPGIAVFLLLSIWLQWFAFRCTGCFGNFGPLVMQQGVWLSVSDSLKYCPYCGMSLDDELDPTGSDPWNA